MDFDGPVWRATSTVSPLQDRLSEGSLVILWPEAYGIIASEVHSGAPAPLVSLSVDGLPALCRRARHRRSSRCAFRPRTGETVRAGTRGISRVSSQSPRPHHPALAQRFSDPPAPKPSRPPGPRPDPAATPAGADITKKLDEFTRLPAADRAKFAADLALEIRALPAGMDKYLLAWNLRVEAIEAPGLEPNAAAAVLSLYAEVIHNYPSTGGYLDLAELATPTFAPRSKAQPSMPPKPSWNSASVCTKKRTFRSQAWTARLTRSQACAARRYC
jgi:hypothetical protein